MQQLRNSCRYRYQRQKSLNEPVLLELFDIPIIPPPSLLDKLTTNHPAAARDKFLSSFHQRSRNAISPNRSRGGREKNLAVPRWRRLTDPINRSRYHSLRKRFKNRIKPLEKERELHPSFEENISHPSAAAVATFPLPPPPPPPNAARLGIVFPSTLSTPPAQAT